MTTTNDTKQQVKTIDVTCLEWFDKVNGNSYFAGNVTVNYGMENEKTYNMPFQYGYGDAYLQSAKELLFGEGVLSSPFEWKVPALTTYCREHGIILRTTKHENCKKRELMQF